ncbi:carotenoid cleavage dioxygenase [Chloropicon primus]|uniref:Carotenoid cleavage dioxygenase n=1 Tax=Chloropicon primus TaxID=1764295 RepID=A0A5B8MNR7_9CHLO|nr:carotenoid cleavage dioxygenase [Chloropicon primus]|eukprot:QDZ22037.1 carotenoid cleavage dioxygenase [Chloropicon primus]
MATLGREARGGARQAPSRSGGGGAKGIGLPASLARRWEWRRGARTVDDDVNVGAERSSSSSSSSSAAAAAVGGGRRTRARDVRGNEELERHIEYVFDPTRGETGPVTLPEARVPVGFPAGSYLRNGPNTKYGVGSDHFFDGDGMIHLVSFLPSGKVSYCNRWVQSTGYKKEKEAGQKLFKGILVNNGVEMLKGIAHNIIFHGALGTNGTKETTNTAVVSHAGKILALMEAQKPVRMELVVKDDQLQRFETAEAGYDFDGMLEGNMTAHPKKDPVTGEMLLFSYDMTSQPHMRYTEVSADGQIKHSVGIRDMKRGSMAHDMAITSDHTILFDLPLEFSFSDMITRNEFPVQFKKDAQARLGLIKRGGGTEVQWFDIARGGNVFHTVNAYNDEGTGEIVLHALRSEPERSGYVFNEYSPSYLHEWRLNPNTNGVQEKRLGNLGSEFPCINPMRQGRKAKFAYMVVDTLLGNLKTWAYPDVGVTYQTFAKVLLDDNDEEGRRQGEVVSRFDAEEGLYLFEPTFVPSEGSSAEDDGFLVCTATNPVVDKSFFLIFDAQNLEKGPLSSIELPEKVCSGLHGKSRKRTSKAHQRL